MYFVKAYPVVLETIGRAGKRRRQIGTVIGDGIMICHPLNYGQTAHYGALHLYLLDET